MKLPLLRYYISRLVFERFRRFRCWKVSFLIEEIVSENPITQYCLLADMFCKYKRRPKGTFTIVSVTKHFKNNARLKLRPIINLPNFLSYIFTLFSIHWKITTKKFGRYKLHPKISPNPISYLHINNKHHTIITQKHINHLICCLLL